MRSKTFRKVTQNANESFNGVLWNIYIVPKQNFVDLQSLKLVAYIAVLQFNEGAGGLLKVINKLGFNAGSYMIRVLKLYDCRRINDAERHSLPFTKLKRKKTRALKKKKGLHQEETEGVTYHPGNFRQFCDVRVLFGRTPWSGQRPGVVFSSPRTNLTRGLVARRLFRGTPCHKGILHLLTTMPSSGIEPRPYSRAVNATNHYTG
ncbi:uncharacterized protein TNCV_261951 [Trichonephila clavipes]|nr:uncharacterized protein TNCV_261951 [Trichonephila clavipes]